MKKLLNTLYVTTQGLYIHRENETIVIEKEREKVLQLPVHAIGGLVCFGNILCSPSLLALCAERDIAVSFLSKYGKFLASVRGPVSGNVLLRRNQYRFADNDEIVRYVSANIICGKLSNSRIVINRAIRDHSDKIDIEPLKSGSVSIGKILDNIDKKHNADEIRGLEGLAAAEYFGVFNHMIINQKDDFIFKDRNRRPPLDEVNALLSFTYTLLAHDVRSSLETVGLDPAVGFLHRDRSGRPGLALDLMEEFRPVIADRLVLSLINRKQISKSGFKKSASGAVIMNDETRKTLLAEYQSRKQEEIYHPYIEETVKIGLLFFIQSNLMARYIRGDIDGYPPFFWR